MENNCMNENIAEAINKLGAFCGKRDVKELTRKCLQEKYDIEQADVMVLFGGSILEGGDVLASAIRNHIANKFLIVGGEGHTTETLRKIVHNEYPHIETGGLSEAEVFQSYLKNKYNESADFIETKSTNCGNNITYLLELIKTEAIVCHSIILCQDATMQCRMDAGLRKYMPKDLCIINYASYQVEVIGIENMLEYRSMPHGMWSIDRYVNLLMGEIPRLLDDENGYGPNGKDFIAHVDIPEDVKSALNELKKIYGNEVRNANPLYATKENLSFM